MDFQLLPRHGQNERVIAPGCKSWLFAAPNAAPDRAAAMTTMIMTAKLYEIDPLAWLAEVLARIADIPAEPRVCDNP